MMTADGATTGGVSGSAGRESSTTGGRSESGFGLGVGSRRIPEAGDEEQHGSGGAAEHRGDSGREALRSGTPGSAARPAGRSGGGAAARAISA